MDHLRASFAYHHRCIPQLLKGQTRLLGAIILAVSFLRFVRAQSDSNGSSRCCAFLFVVDQQIQSFSLSRHVLPSLHRGHNDLVSDHRSRHLEGNYIPS